MNESIFYMTALVLFFSVLLAVYNSNAVVKKYRIKSEKVTKKLRIAVISDFHNKKYNHNNVYLIEKIRALAPDVIIISGDFTDRRHPDYDVARRFLTELRLIADTYYVTGNHEAVLGIDNVVNELSSQDIMLDEKFVIFKDFSLLGLSDRIREMDVERQNKLRLFEKLSNYKIVVTHRPTEFDDYLNISKYDVDLVIAGHTHGGLIRIPFFGALACPNEGLFPKYSKGMYKKGSTAMVVSGGLGNTGLPLRINNFPEIVVIDIEN